MRILFCTNSLGAHGGIERVTIVKANALADVDGNVVGVCYTDRGQYPDNTIHPVSGKLHVFDLGVPFWDLHPLDLRNLLVTAPKRFYALRKRLKRLIAEFKPDVVITTGSYEKYALATLRLPRAVKIREFHFNSQYRRYAGAGRLAKLTEAFDYAVLSRLFDMNLLLTREDLESNFAGRHGFDYQANPSSFAVSSLPEYDSRENTVMAVGRLSPEKNLASLLKIWSKTVRPEGWRLLIVGEGPQREMLESLARQLDISDTVSFLGFRRDVPDLLMRSKVLAATSLHEGFGLNLVEAQSCGVVPISYATPYGPRDVIDDGVDGVLVDYLDEVQFAAKLGSLLSSPDQMRRFSTAAVEHAQAYHVDRIVAQLMDKYKTLSDKKRK